MTHTRAIQMAILFWSLFIYCHNLFAGSGGAAAESLCAHTIEIVLTEKSSGANEESTLADFNGWLANAPMRNPLYDQWAADMTRDMIRIAFAQDTGDGWREQAMRRCIAWSRGEVQAN